MVECFPLREIFETYNVGSVIDLVSIDTEGMEMEALQSIDFSRVNIRVLVVEWTGTDGDQRKDYLQQFGYRSVKISTVVKIHPENGTVWKLMGDELFWRPDLFSNW